MNMFTDDDAPALTEQGRDPDKVAKVNAEALNEKSASVIADFFSILSDPTRVRIVHSLMVVDELSVNDLALTCGASQTAVSHQLKGLRTSGIVTRRREGRVIYYSLASYHLGEAFEDFIDHVTRLWQNTLSNAPFAPDEPQRNGPAQSTRLQNRSPRQRP